jgi:hypothetical protein
MQIKTRESDTKKACADLLEVYYAQGKLVFQRLNSGDFIEVRGTSRRRIIGCKPGTSDFHIDTLGYSGRNRSIYIEVKSSTGTQSPKQCEFALDVEAQSAEYYVVRDADELREILSGRE